MKFENTEVWGFKHAIRGMRNPLESWNKSDSKWEEVDYEYKDKISYFDMKSDEGGTFIHIIGKNDLKLMQNLIKAGSPDRKFLRQIFVSVDITAPLYWWKEFDTYKVGTVANSTSQMHKLSTTSITIDCFEMDDFSPVGRANSKSWELIISLCEDLRIEYLKTKDKRYWKELIRILPLSWLQTRTITMNYENLLSMCSKGQRRYHKLNEWSGNDNPNLPNFISWARTLPYAQELIFLDELDKDSK